MSNVIYMDEWLASKGVVDTTFTRRRTEQMLTSEEYGMTGTQKQNIERRIAGKRETLRRREVRKLKYGVEVR